MASRQGTFYSIHDSTAECFIKMLRLKFNECNNHDNGSSRWSGMLKNNAQWILEASCGARRSSWEIIKLNAHRDLELLWDHRGAASQFFAPIVGRSRKTPKLALENLIILVVNRVDESMLEWPGSCKQKHDWTTALLPRMFNKCYGNIFLKQKKVFLWGLDKRRKAEETGGGRQKAQQENLKNLFSNIFIFARLFPCTTSSETRRTKKLCLIHLNAIPRIPDWLYYIYAETRRFANCIRNMKLGLVVPTSGKSESKRFW